MRQALHIFSKDVRYLRWEILATLALVIIFGVSEVRRDPTSHIIASTVLLPVAVMYLIARLVHAEALPGHRQFWLTRPHSWKSLLAAKMLFILAFITLPLTFADAAIVGAQGFSISRNVSGLAWEQLLWWLAIFLPVAALAAVTPGLVGLVSPILFVLALFIGLDQASGGLHVPDWRSWDWLRGSLEIAVLCSCGTVLIWQYARRGTTLARIGLGGILALEVLVLFLPPSVGFSMQAALSKTQFDGSRLSLAFNPARTTVVHDREGRTRIALSLRMEGVPQGLQIREDGVRACIEDAAGRTLWQGADDRQMDWFFEAQPGSVLEFMDMNGGLFDRLKDQPVRIKTSALFTLYGNQRTIDLPRSGELEIPGVGIFDRASQSFRSAFRPAHVLYSRGGFSTRARYPPPSPFPAELAISPIMTFGLEGWSSDVLTTLEPIAHLRDNFEIGPIRLSDFDIDLGPRN